MYVCMYALSCEMATFKFKLMPINFIIKYYTLQMQRFKYFYSRKERGYCTVLHLKSISVSEFIKAVSNELQHKCALKTNDK